MSASLSLVVNNAGEAPATAIARPSQDTGPARVDVPLSGRRVRPSGSGRRHEWRGMTRRFGAAVRTDRGAVTAEYAIVIMAAVAFAGLLVAIMRSGEIRAILVDLVQNALGSAG